MPKMTCDRCHYYRETYDPDMGKCKAKAGLLVKHGYKHDDTAAWYSCGWWTSMNLIDHIIRKLINWELSLNQRWFYR